MLQRVKYLYTNVGSDKVILFHTTETMMSFTKTNVNHFYKFSFKGDMYRIDHGGVETLERFLNGDETRYVRKLSEKELDWFNRVEKDKFKKA